MNYENFDNMRTLMENLWRPLDTEEMLCQATAEDIASVLSLH